MQEVVKKCRDELSAMRTECSRQESRLYDFEHSHITDTDQIEKLLKQTKADRHEIDELTAAVAARDSRLADLDLITKKDHEDMGKLKAELLDVTSKNEAFAAQAKKRKDEMAAMKKELARVNG